MMDSGQDFFRLGFRLGDFATCLIILDGPGSKTTQVTGAPDAAVMGTFQWDVLHSRPGWVSRAIGAWHQIGTRPCRQHEGKKGKTLVSDAHSSLAGISRLLGQIRFLLVRGGFICLWGRKYTESSATSICASRSRVGSAWLPRASFNSDDIGYWAPAKSRSPRVISVPGPTSLGRASHPGTAEPPGIAACGSSP